MQKNQADLAVSKAFRYFDKKALQKSKMSKNGPKYVFFADICACVC